MYFKNKKLALAWSGLLPLLLSHAQLFVTPWTIVHQASLSMGFPGKNTGTGCHTLLQGIFLTQGLKPLLLCLLSWQVGSLPLSHLGNTFSQLLGDNK